MTLVIGADWRVVNFKWVNDSSNSIYVSLIHATDDNLSKILKFVVGTCDHFQMAKHTKQIDIHPSRDLNFEYVVDDFCFDRRDPKKVFAFCQNFQLHFNIETGEIIKQFLLASDQENKFSKQNKRRLMENNSDDLEEQNMDIVETTCNRVMFAQNEHSQMEIHDLNGSEKPISINFDKQICNIRANPFHESLFLVLLTDMLVLFDIHQMKDYKVNVFKTLDFHDINWSHKDPRVMVVCGEFKNDDAISFSGFIKIKKLRKLDELFKVSFSK